jgi:hypothetical protein
MQDIMVRLHNPEDMMATSGEKSVNSLNYPERSFVDSSNQSTINNSGQKTGFNILSMITRKDGRIFKTSIKTVSKRSNTTKPFIVTSLIALTLFIFLSTLVMSHATGTTTPWQQIGLADKKVVSIAISPCFSNDATLFAATPHSLYKSTDLGVNWSEKNNGIKKKNIQSIAISPTYQTDKTLFLATKEHGIYKSTDAADSWVKLSCDDTIKGAETLAISPGFSADKTIFAATTGKKGGVYKSTDSGS